MITCPTCQRRPTKRDGREPPRPPKLCLPSLPPWPHCRLSSIFAGYRWPAEVILAAVRWYLSYPLSIGR